MKWCYIVTIKNLSVEDSKEAITRVFTKREDAKIFIQDCKKHEKGEYRYKKFRSQLDGNPLTGFYSVHEA